MELFVGVEDVDVAAEVLPASPGQAQTLLPQLQKRFGPLPTAVAQRMPGASPAELERWLDRILDAATVIDVFAAD